MNLFGEYQDLVIAILLIAIVVLLILVLVQHSKVKKLNWRIDQLTMGSDGESLEDMLIRILDHYNEINGQLEKNSDAIKDIYRRLHFMIQKVGVVKYDAFKQMGGSLSSVIVLLDQNNSGIMINTVQSTSGCYSYVKEITKGKSDVAFTEEEEEAMKNAVEIKKQ